MDRDTAVARVKMHLGFKKNLDADIIQAMIEMQDQLENDPELPDFLRIPYSALATVANTKTLNVPSDFIREYDGDQLSVTNADGDESNVVKDIEGNMRLRWPITDDPGVPRNYCIVNRVFRFYPTPDAVYTLKGTYYAKDTVLNTNIENKWLNYLPEILIARSALVLASGLRDKDALTLMQAMNSAATAKLHMMTTASDMAGMRPIIGGED